MPLVENLARKFSTSDQASGILSINDLIQIGNEGLVKSVDRLDWLQLVDSQDIEKTLKSFISKRVKGAIRRRIDMNRGDMRIPEHKLNEIRNNPEDKKAVALFFNSIFLSIDERMDDDDDLFEAYQIPDQNEVYNIELMNAYLVGLLKKHLDDREFEVLRLSYGLDCPLLDFKGKLRDIQQAPIDAFIDNVITKKKLGGIISVPCGFGKTIMAIYWNALRLKFKRIPFFSHP